MGVQLADLVFPGELDFEALRGKKIAIDAMNSLYQFLSIIRQPTGEPLRDRQGRVTSHLSGLLYRNVNLIEYGIKPIYVFDGKPPSLKGGVVEKRMEVRETAGKKWKQALQEGKLEEARVFAMQSSRFSDEMLQDAKKLLGFLGIPWVQAPSEGEAQAARMVREGDAWAVGSQDYDSLLFGSPRLIRNLTISGRRKLPRKNVYVEVKPVLLSLRSVLSELGISREQLIDLSILVGTDYNPGGIEGIGPKKALNLIQEYGSAEEAIREKGIEANFDLEAVKRLFLNPQTTSKYLLDWKAPKKEEVINFLCGERDFSVERVTKVLEKLEISFREAKQQSSLDSWFS
jgi:flap endonuclease-1